MFINYYPEVQPGIAYGAKSQSTAFLVATFFGLLIGTLLGSAIRLGVSAQWLLTPLGAFVSHFIGIAEGAAGGLLGGWLFFRLRVFRRHGYWRYAVIGALVGGIVTTIVLPAWFILAVAFSS